MSLINLHNKNTTSKTVYNKFKNQKKFKKRQSRHLQSTKIFDRVSERCIRSTATFLTLF